MISSFELRRAANDTEVVLPKDKVRVLAIIEKAEERVEGAVQAFCGETNLRIQLVSQDLKYVADNLNLESVWSSDEKAA